MFFVFHQTMTTEAKVHAVISRNEDAATWPAALVLTKYEEKHCDLCFQHFAIILHVLNENFLWVAKFPRQGT